MDTQTLVPGLEERLGESIRYYGKTCLAVMRSAVSVPREAIPAAISS